jgi:RNA polymerase sigma-70 factor (ECF subfamily)
MAEDDRSTEGLARRGAEGDEAAFAELFRRVKGRLGMWIELRMGPLLRSRLTVEDVLQETFLQAHRSLDGFRAQGEGSFRRWIFSVAENRLRDLHKYHAAEKRHPRREAIDPRDSSFHLWQSVSSGDPSPSSGAGRAELSERVVAAIGRLPERLREVLVLRTVEQRSTREVAERLGWPIGTVKGTYARAMRKLRDELRSATDS